MKPFTASIIAAFIATVVLSILMLIKSSMGVMPELNVIKMLASQMNSTAGMGWVAHFVIGTVGYAIAYTVITIIITTEKPILMGIIVGILGWLVMMVALMPMMGKGLFATAMGMGPMPAVATLVLHIIFGFVLGYTVCKLTQQKSS